VAEIGAKSPGQRYGRCPVPGLPYRPVAAKIGKAGRLHSGYRVAIAHFPNQKARIIARALSAAV